MTDQRQPAPTPLASRLATDRGEWTERRAAGTHAGMTRLRDDELAALLALLRREVGGTGSSENTSHRCEISEAGEVA